MPVDIYFYVEGYYQKKDKRPSSWKRVRLNEVDEKIRNPSGNYNCFTTIQRFKNAIQEQGEPQIADLFFDLDGEISDAKADAISLYDYFAKMGVGKEAIRVWFSGKKGFHVLVNYRVLGVSPHPELTYIYKLAANYVCHSLRLKTFDYRVYTIKRMFRIPGSIHRDTGKFKTELTRKELELDVLKLKDLATQPRNPLWEDQDVDDLASNETAVAWFSNFLKQYDDEKSLQKLRPRTPIKKSKEHPVCIKHILGTNRILVDGSGNKTALALVSYFKDKAYTEKQALDELVPWVTSLQNTSTSRNKREAEASLRSVAHSVYHDKDKYRFACAFIRATGNAENPVNCLGDMCSHVDTKGQEPNDPIAVHLSEASRSEFVGKKLKIQTMIQGKDQAPYIVPRKFEVECAPDADGKFCANCPSMTYGGKFECEFKPTDEGLVEMTKTSRSQRTGVLRHRAKIPGTCKRWKIRVLDMTNIEEVRLIPQVDFSEQNFQEYAVRLGFYVGHGIKTNQRYEIIGYTMPDPRSQYAVEVFEHAAPSETSIQAFEPEDKTLKQLEIFRPSTGQSVEEKMAEIHADLESNVTKIHRRSLMAIAVDLVYHTVLSFNFNSGYVHKGWGELLIIGDSGQAKSTLLQRLRTHYQAGEIINGESASRTGLLYTLTDSSNRWFLVWGRIPLNDMSLLVIDEASGLSHDDIAQLSGPRSSGIAEVNRVGISAQTPCRTRLIFSSNPRTGKPLRSYTFVVSSICGFRELIDKAEDVRRFDFAVAVKSGDVKSELINSATFADIKHVHTSYLCNLLIRWAWSRKSDQTEFTEEATADILKAANMMGKIYHSSIPLVEPADQRLKIARIAAAVAVRMFSTDAKMEKVIVKSEHVTYAIGIMMNCFHTLNYDRYSKQIFEDTVLSDEKKQRIVREFTQLVKYKELANALLRYRELPFTKMSLREQMGYDRDEANEVIHFLSRNFLVENTSRGYIKREYFIELLNDFQEGKLTDIPERQKKFAADSSADRGEYD